MFDEIMEKHVLGNIILTSFCSISPFHAIRVHPEAEEYAVEGKTDFSLLRSSDGFSCCSHGC